MKHRMVFTHGEIFVLAISDPMTFSYHQRVRCPRPHVSICERSYDGVHWAMVMKMVQLPDGRTMAYTRK